MNTPQSSRCKKQAETDPHCWTRVVLSKNSYLWFIV